MNKAKRNLAKVLGAAGVGAVVWKKPMVDAVSLPAHAETSCTQIMQTIPDVTLSCSDEPSQFVVVPYLVQADGDCFTLVQGEEFMTTTDPDDLGIPYNIFSVHRRFGSVAQVAIVAFDENGDVIDGGTSCCFNQLCTDNGSFNSEDIIATTALDTSGTERSLTNVIEAFDDGTVTIRDIVVS